MSKKKIIGIYQKLKDHKKSFLVGFSSLLFLIFFSHNFITKQYACIVNPAGGCAFFGCNGTNTCSVWSSGPKFIDLQCSNSCNSVTPSLTPTPTNALPLPSPVRINSLDTIVGGGGIQAFNSAALSSYNNNNPELQVWSYSSCSGCAIASVINFYGGATKGNHAGTPISGGPTQINCGDVLEYENSIGAWSVDSGLLGWATIVRTGGNFGFNVSIGDAGQTSRSIADIINIANGGQPVVVGVVDHVLDIRGGDTQNVYLIDSSLHNYQTVSIDTFTRTGLSKPTEKWDGSYAILTPQ